MTPERLTRIRKAGGRAQRRREAALRRKMFLVTDDGVRHQTTEDTMFADMHRLRLKYTGRIDLLTEMAK